MEVPGLGINQSSICNLHRSLKKHHIFKLSREARDQTHIITDTIQGSSPAEPQWELLDGLFAREYVCISTETATLGFK